MKLNLIQLINFLHHFQTFWVSFFSLFHCSITFCVHVSKNKGRQDYFLAIFFPCFCRVKVFSFERMEQIFDLDLKKTRQGWCRAIWECQKCFTQSLQRCDSKELNNKYLISVFYAEDELSLGLDGKKFIKKSCPQSSQMHHSCRRRRVPDSDWELKKQWIR